MLNGLKRERVPGILPLNRLGGGWVVPPGRPGRRGQPTLPRLMATTHVQWLHFALKPGARLRRFAGHKASGTEPNPNRLTESALYSYPRLCEQMGVRLSVMASGLSPFHATRENPRVLLKE